MNYIASLIKVLNHPLNRNQKLATLGRIGWWKCNQWFFHLPAKVAISPKSSLLCYPETSFGSYVVYARLPEYAETQFLGFYLKPSDSFLDIGAHLGEYAILAAEKIERGTIIAFEPTPQSRVYLTENLALNNLSGRVLIDERAVSTKAGTAFFALEAEAEVNHLVTKSSRVKKLRIKTVSLDTVIGKANLKQVGLVKIDVEGAELAVLKGASKSLKRAVIKAMILEVNPTAEWYQTNPDQLFSLLTKFGYQHYAFTKTGKLKPFDPTQPVSTTCNILAAHQSIFKSRIKSLLTKK
jgi:FkbM family methyltransferase